MSARVPVTGAVRVGLVGFGMAGRDFHAPLLRATEGLTVALVVTGNPERAESARIELAARVVPTYDDLLAATDDLDLVVLATPTQLHAEQAIAAVEHGLAVVVDKPLATSLADARRVVALAEAAGVPVTTFQNRRWDPEHLTAKRLLAEGSLGDIVRYEARYERWRPQPKDRWRENLTTEQGGGQLHDLQSHLVDGAIDLFGPITSVYAELAALTTAGDDVTFLAVEHQSGVRSHLGATSLAGVNGPRTRLLGRAAAYLVANVADETTAHADWRDADDQHRGWLVRGDEREPVRRQPGSAGAFYPAVVAAICDGAPMPVDVRDSVHVVEVLEAARRSARDGTTVRLDVAT
jgi:predicted dehydrogenase